MDMHNWLQECIQDGSIDIEELEAVMKYETQAKLLWQYYACDSDDFVEFVQEEVQQFLNQHYRKLKQHKKRDSHESK
jgi:hypothetical protein